MLRLVALLPPEEGALVASVLESIALERSQRPAQAAGETLAEGREAPEVPDPAEDPWAARRADALVAVCGFHHRRLHEGSYTIRHERDGSLGFEARSGRPIKAQSQRLDCASAGAPHLRGLHQGRGLTMTAGTAGARSGGERCDVDHTLFVLCTNAEYRERQAGHSP